MLGDVGLLVGLLVIIVVFGRAFMGTLPGRGRGGGGSAWGIFFADLVVRFGTTVVIVLARLVGALTMGAVRFGRSRMERAAGRPPRTSVDFSRRPEQPREPRQPPNQGDASDPWADDD